VIGGYCPSVSGSGRTTQFHQSCKYFSVCVCFCDIYIKKVIIIAILACLYPVSSCGLLYTQVSDERTTPYLIIASKSSYRILILPRIKSL